MMLLQISSEITDPFGPTIKVWVDYKRVEGSREDIVAVLTALKSKMKDRDIRIVQVLEQ